MLEVIKKTLRRTPLASVVTAGRNRSAIRQWEEAGRPVPPPPAFKQSVVRLYAQRFRLQNLVETGTYQAEMVAAQQQRFQRIVSIELDSKLFQSAEARFAQVGNVTILQGDSSQVLPGVVKELTEPCLFWLDAHYSGGITARGGLDTPIVQELEIIFSRKNDQDVILIDDAHCFNGSNDYPRLEELDSFISSTQPQSLLENSDNILRLTQEHRTAGSQ